MDPTPVDPDDDDDSVPVYTMNICERLADHEVCPMFTTLYAGEFELGPVVCDCDCHRKQLIGVTQ
jgi:hypothetical protein